MNKFKLIIALLTLSNFLNAQNTIISEEILVMNDSIKLPGTLTYNSNLEVQPLVIFVHGSGNIDRNGNQAMLNPNANYIKMLNDSLVKKNIAFYRFDKRSATRSNLKYMMSNMNFDAFIDDINLIVKQFDDDKRFSSITLIGHSQGSLISMLVDHTNIDKYISLAGPSDSVDKALIRQVRHQNGDSLGNIVNSHFKELTETGTIKKVDPNLLALFNKPTQPFLLSWIKYDPSKEIKNVNIPILIINGKQDIQVLVKDAKALHEANPKSKLILIDKMNHTLKIQENDEDYEKSQQVYDLPLSIELVNVIETFIKQ